MDWKQGDDGTWTAEGVPLFGPGKWNGGEWTEDFCRKLVEKTMAFLETVKPRLVPGHPREDLDDAGYRAWLSQQPRWGLLQNIRYAMGKVVADIRQIPERVKQAIDAGEWGAMSIVIKRHDGDPVIDNVGLLGAAAPAVPYAGVDAFAERHYLVFMLGAIQADGETPHSQTTVEGGQAGEEPVSEPPTSDGARSSDGLSDEAKEEDVADEKAGVEALAAKEAEIADLKAQLQRQDEARQAFAQKVKADRLDSAFAHLLDAGKVTPAMKDDFVAVGMDLDDTTVHSFSGGREKGTRLDQHIAAWEAREPMKKATSPKSAGTGEESEGDYQDRALAFAEKYVADGRGSLADGLGAFQHQTGDEDYKTYRKQFAGAAPSEVTTAATFIRGGK